MTPRSVDDTGASLVEILVAVVLVGLAAAATLTTMSTTIRASSQHKDHSGAQAWLVSAADVLTSSATPRVPCTSMAPTPFTAYDAVVKAVTAGRPAGWAATSIEVVAPVEYSDGTGYGTGCHEVTEPGLTSQAITIQVTSPDGRVSESLTVVKHDG